jgi:hypothetical protein
MPDAVLLLGASDVYPKLGSTLQSCWRDVESMYAWYDSHYPMTGVEYRAFKDMRYTKANFFDAAHTLCGLPGIKRCAIDVSCHGTTIPKNGANHAAIVFADSTWDDEEGTFGFDDDFAELFNEYPNINFYMTADACESANLVFRILPISHNNKFIAPPSDLQSQITHNANNGAVQRGIAPLLPNVAYVSGTGGPGFYSVDEGDGGAFHKAWTRIVDPSWNPVRIAAELDSVLDKSQQPTPHGGRINNPWFT